MDNMTEDEKAALRAALLSHEFQSLMGAEDWDLTEEQEMLIWGIIERELGR